MAKQIEREVGNLLLTDKVLQKAVCPEKRIGIDSALSAIASVTEVEVSNDLTIAKVYLSVFSDDEGKRIAISGLKRLEGYVRKHIAVSMNLRMAPEVRFFQDDTIERAEQVYALLDSIKADRQSEAAPDASNHISTAGIETFDGSEGSGAREEPIELDTDALGDVASIQLIDSDSDKSKITEKPLVRRVRLPGASQRSPSLKLRRRK